MKYLKLVLERFKQQQVFSIAELRLFLAKLGISKNYSYLLIHNLLSKKELHRVSRGFYSFQNDVIVAGFAFQPFYYGLQEALSLRNLWEQETNPVIITPKKVRSGLRIAMGANVLVRRINRKMFFGFDLIKYYDYWLPVSDLEKTLIDFVYFNEHLPKEAFKEIKTKINKKKLVSYLRKCPPITRKKIKKILKL